MSMTGFKNLTKEDKELLKANRPTNMAELRRVAIQKKEYWMTKRKKILSAMAHEKPYPKHEQWSQLAETSTALNLTGFFIIWIDSVEASARRRNLTDEEMNLFDNWVDKWLYDDDELSTKEHLALGTILAKIKELRAGNEK